MVKATCINSKNKPSIIPDSLWIKEGKEYTIIHVYSMVNQKGIQGCDVKGLDISAYIPYNCFKLERFGFKKEDVPSLMELIKNCTELQDVDIEKLLKESVLNDELR